MFAKIIDGHNGIMFERGDHLGFALETCTKLRVECELLRQNLYRDLTFDVWITCEIYDCHPPSAKFLEHFITTDVHGDSPISCFLVQGILTQKIGFEIGPTDRSEERRVGKECR